MGQTAVQSAARYSENPQAIQRDLDRGVLNAQSEINRYIEDPGELSKFDPLPFVVSKVNEWKQGLRQHPGRTAAQTLHWLPSCGKGGPAINAVKEAGIVNRSNKAVATFTRWLETAKNLLPPAGSRLNPLKESDVLSKLLQASEKVNQHLTKEESAILRKLEGNVVQFSRPESGSGLGSQLLGRRIGAGGFGDVYELPDRPTTVVKIFHNVANESRMPITRQVYGDKLLNAINVPTPDIYAARTGGPGNFSYLVMRNVEADVLRLEKAVAATPSNDVREVPGAETAVRNLARKLGENGLFWGDMRGQNIYFTGSGSSMVAGVLDTDMVMKATDIGSKDPVISSIDTAIFNQFTFAPQYLGVYQRAYAKRDAMELNRVFFRKMFGPGNRCASPKATGLF